MLPRVAIPSYNRAEYISGQGGSLRLLADSNYPLHLIYIFVHSQDQKDLYTRVVPVHLYNEIVVGVPGLAEQHNFITDFFDEDEIVLHMDDDVKGIKTSPTMGLIDLVLKGSKCVERACGLWGIMPNDDGRRMEDKTTVHLAHIIGCFYISKNHREVRITTVEKDDFERTVLYFKLYGAVARYKGAGIATGYEKTPGGLQAEGRRDRMLTAIQYMLTMYPGYVAAVNKPKGQDIVLNWRAI
jgi:hypothetical protein